MCCVGGVGGTMVSGTTQQCTINITTQTLCSIIAYATHSGSYSTEHEKEVHYTLVHTCYTVVHNIHSSAQHIQDTETFRLPERQVASTMISVLILSST